MKKRWITVFCAILLAMLVVAAADTPVSAKAGAWDKGKKEVQTKGAFTYYIHPSKNGKEAWVYKIKIKGKKSKSLSIPKTIRGKKVTRLGCPDRGKGDDNEAYTTLFGTYIEPWHNWDGSGAKTASAALKTIRIPDSVKVIDRAAFSGLNSVTTIKLPKKIKKIDIYTFYGCDKLKTIVLPEQMDSFQNSSLWGCPSLKEIRLSKKNKTFESTGNALIRKKNKALLFAATGGKAYTIPDGVKKVTSYSFSGAVSPVVYIPDSVAEIEGKAFNLFSIRENSKIKDVVVSEQNPAFARDGQCIYRRADKSLAVAIPDEKGDLQVSGQVEKLTGDISLVNCDTFSEKNLGKVVYPSSLKHVVVPGLTIINADNVYFTGSVPPEVTDPDNAEDGVLPVYCHIHVPAAYEDAYKAWYQKYEPYSNVDGWHTYHPETGI
ncbi:MAG: leucine-rich repeat protein [Eubacterium sp.]|jgi:hypothetical protein|nr:leucine-rich repeat protein [Eubacterium sp.]